MLPTLQNGKFFYSIKKEYSDKGINLESQNNLTLYIEVFKIYKGRSIYD